MNQSPLGLWYDKPAGEWVEALPLGNGRIGAMVYSIPGEELIRLNEDTLWSGYPRDKGPGPGAWRHFEEARRLIRAGESRHAQEVIERRLLGEYTESYLPLGDLRLSFPHIGNVEDYRRALDLREAVVRTSFLSGGVLHTREAFVSYPDQALVLRLEADRPGQITFTATLDSPLRCTVTAREGALELEGLCPSHVEPNYMDCDEPVLYEEEDAKKGMRFLALLRAVPEGGSVRLEERRLTVQGADRVTLYLCARTSFNGYNRQPYLDGAPYRAPCRRDLEAVSKQEYGAVRVAHTADHGALFDRVELRLDGPSRADLPTGARLRALADDPFDAGLFALIFQYGRYLLIASSRPGTQAANLQGIWNSEMRPPWSSNYTVNINTEMNYWPAESCNLSELHEPLFRLIAAIADTGRDTARELYSAGGYTAHHNIDLWAHATPVGARRTGSAVYGFWPMSAGWLCRHLYEHYLYTADRAFLEQTAYPLIRGAAAFYLDLLEEDGEGHLILSPSTSPENQFKARDETLCVARTAVMTMGIVRETLENAAVCCRSLGVRDAFAARLDAAIPKLPPYRAGAGGQLLEWERDYEEADPHHRHTSHLYALHPAHHITPEETPQLADACRATLQRRGDEGTGWCLAWRINLWARLKDGDHALELLRRQLRLVEASKEIRVTGGGTYPNLFDAHPPFQIDGNFGASAGIAELFLQCRNDRIELLPALPAAFTGGEMRGLRAHGGLTVDLTFRQGALAEARVHAGERPAGPMRFVYRGKVKILSLRAGEYVNLLPGDFE